MKDKYLESIKSEIINGNAKVIAKNYQINTVKLTMNYNIGRKLVEAGKHYGEGIVKKEYFEKLLPSVPVRLVAKHVSKADAVNPTNSILIDDHSPNLVDFEEQGGLGIKFDEDKTEDYRSYIQNGKTYEFLTINNLEDILKINFNKNKTSIKVKQKTF